MFNMDHSAVLTALIGLAMLNDCTDADVGVPFTHDFNTSLNGWIVGSSNWNWTGDSGCPDITNVSTFHSNGNYIWTQKNFDTPKPTPSLLHYNYYEFVTGVTNETKLFFNYWFYTQDANCGFFAIAYAEKNATKSDLFHVKTILNNSSDWDTFMIDCSEDSCCAESSCDLQLFMYGSAGCSDGDGLIAIRSVIATTTDATTSDSTDIPTINSTDLTNTNSTDLTDTNSTDLTNTNSTDLTDTNSTDIAITNSTDMPTINSTDLPTINSTYTPTINSTDIPTINSTDTPAINSTDTPTVNSTDLPTINFTDTPAINSTDLPTINSTDLPTMNSTDTPTVNSTDTPTINSTDLSIINSTDISETNSTEITTSNSTETTSVNTTKPVLTSKANKASAMESKTNGAELKAVFTLNHLILVIVMEFILF